MKSTNLIKKALNMVLIVSIIMSFIAYPVSLFACGVPLLNQFDETTHPNPQYRANACGPVALAMALQYYGKNYGNLPALVEATGVTATNGATANSLINTANTYLPNSHYSWLIEFYPTSMAYLQSELNSGAFVIVPISVPNAPPEGHYVLVWGFNATDVIYNDPATGAVGTMTINAFAAAWAAINDHVCISIHGGGI